MAARRPDEEDDALALQVLARAQARAWGAGDERARLARTPAGEDGVAAWDAPRRRQGERDGQGDDYDRGPGLAPGRDRPGPTRFDPRPGGRELSESFTERGWAGKLAMAQLAVSWPRIVGERVAEHTRVVAFEVGRLDVQATSTAWAQQLRLLMPSIQREVAEELARVTAAGPGPGGRRRVEVPAVEVRVLGPTGPTWGHGRFGAARGGRGPRDTYG
ncbi:DUF721 domain-containing protein [Actinomyces sp. 186855]|nr:MULTISPECIES: DciA family protein [unclassified Actinomyces]MCL3778543.1 DUF721 domain-containing protein [Actinomyces sp. AC-20-1]MCL3789496.1 DUF721 domain-containing protein [Actinomyces sp. 187325]MCL3791825.1 DUF721 domain-containing protein [Actinomyces sp. 186855]MCL3793504.1 DUF721 domain-containing protein [Actinomyces sp. 217892]